MKITLSFEKTQTKDTSIMVDALRASTTITLALNNFNEIIPCFTPEEAFELKKEINGIIAGERSGKRVEGFDVGNSPKDVENYDTDIETLILTTSNGTRILKDMNSTVLVGSMVNAKAAIMASRDYDALKEGFYNCNSGRKLSRLKSKKDIDCCVLKNISENVAIYENNILKLIKD